MLTNPFYYGEMQYQGKLYRHGYTPLIDKDTFDRCQTVRLGWKKKPFKFTETPFLFRGLVQCGYCGCAYSSEIKKQKYVYMACTKNRDSNCPAPRIREEVLFDQLAVVFDQMAFSDSIMEDLRRGLSKTHESKVEFHRSAVNALQKEYTGIEGKLARLLDAYLNQSITQNEHDKKARELKERREEINRLLRNTLTTTSQSV